MWDSREAARAAGGTWAVVLALGRILCSQHGTNLLRRHALPPPEAPHCTLCWACTQLDRMEEEAEFDKHTSEELTEAGNDLKEANQLSAAERRFSAAIARATTSVEAVVALLHRGKLYECQRRWSLALEDYTAAASLTPDILKCTLPIGSKRIVCLCALGRFSEAADALAELPGPISSRVRGPNHSVTTAKQPPSPCQACTD